MNFRSLLAQVRRTVLEAYTHQDMPFDRLVEELAPDRPAGRSPLFDVLFVVHNTPSAAVTLGDLQMRQRPSPAASSKFDLTLFISEAEREIRAELHFDCTLFEPATIERFISRFRRILAEVCADPDARLSAISLSDPFEAAAMMADFSDSWDLADI